MPVFASDEDVYQHLGRLLVEICADPVLGPQWQRADTVVQYRTFDPDSRTTVDLRADSVPAAYLGGRDDLVPEVVMTMSADTAHRFFLGQISVPVAIARGEIVTSGPAGKVLKLLPLVKPFFPRYRALLDASGRADLVPA